MFNIKKLIEHTQACLESDGNQAVYLFNSGGKVSVNYLNYSLKTLSHPVTKPVSSEGPLRGTGFSDH